MAECIRARLEQGQANATPGAGTTRGAEAAPFTAEPPSAANVPAPPAEEPPGPAPVMPPPPPPAAPAPDASPPAAAPVDVLALGGAIARDRLRGVSRRPGLVALVLGIAWLIGVRLRRRRRRRG